MAGNTVKGKDHIQVFISTEIEEARKRYVSDTYGPNVTMKTEIYQQAMVEFLKARGYWQNGVLVKP